MRNVPLKVLLLCLALGTAGFAQQRNTPEQRAERMAQRQQASREQAKPEETRQPQENARHEQAAATASSHEIKWDMTEQPPVVTHHEIHIAGKTLKYTATAGRMPIMGVTGNIEAEMFYVAYTLDGQEANKRPLTFAFNGGPGSASLWLHMGALGPRRVVLQPDGWMPAAPYRLMDNPYTPLDKTDIVIVDAIGTGYSRPADLKMGKKFWGVQGDIASFGEFIRMYISRNERWTSPLFLFGESYGTTRSAGIAGYLMDHGIALSGVNLLSTVLDFETLSYSRKNDEAFVLTLPTYTMIAAYHKKLAPDLMQDLAKTRAEVEHFASTEYAEALAKGDSISPQEREDVLDKLARYTGLSKDYLDRMNLRVDVRGFTSHLLIDQKLRVGRLDARYTMPDPIGPWNDSFFDPSGAATTPPFVSVFNDYVRNELDYKTDMPYYVSARDAGGPAAAAFQWDWGTRMGYPDTATMLRSAMIKDPYLKVQVMEGYYDLATPYYAANFTMNHMDLPPSYRKNIQYATYDSGHMVYLNIKALAKLQTDYEHFIDECTAGVQ